MTTFEAKLGLNTSNDHQDDRLRPGIPDVIFEINLDDEIVKDQGDGFQWWWGRHEFPPITHSEIVDLFPLFIRIPNAVLNAGLQPHLSITGSGETILYPAASATGNRREFLQNPKVAENQRSLDNRGITIDRNPVDIPIPRGDEEIEFVAKAVGQSLGLGRQQWTLTLWLDNGNNQYIPSDSWRITIQDTKEFWAFYSLRNAAANHLTYSAEDQRKVDTRVYHPATQIGGSRDPDKEKYLLLLHGYNETLDNARIRFNEIYRRLFWLGFRGQFVGVTWHGDVGLWNSGIASALTFDASVQNAFCTSPGLMAFLHSIHNWSGGANNIDIMAHSLGNLVVWDALRLYQTTGQGAHNPLVRNVIGMEAAVWPETFTEEMSLSYQDESDDQNRIVYSVDELKQHSWSFWFNQEAHPAHKSLAGNVYHSYVPNDEILELWMRYGDNLLRGSISSPFPIARKWHYSRDKLTNDPPEWRSPNGTKHSDIGWGSGRGGLPVANIFPSRLPTLMLPRHRKPYYGFEDLNLPVGAMMNPLHNVNNRNATELGWRTDQHSDFAVGESSIANAKMWFPVIWEWYNQFLQPAMIIGEE